MLQDHASPAAAATVTAPCVPPVATSPSPDDAATLEVPAHRLYLFAMGHFLAGFSPDEKPGGDPPAS
jgi:hypothetical protein